MQLLQGGIDCHALRNPSEIELDTGREGHEPAYRIYLHATPSSPWLPGNYRIETDSRKVIESTVIPELHQLIQQGGIVDPLSGLRCHQSSRQDSIEQVTHSNGRSCSLVELGELTLR